MGQEIASEHKVLEVAVRCPRCGGEAFFGATGVFENSCNAVVSCHSCPYRKLQEIQWPKDAYYQIEVCNSILWGWSRSHFVSIRNFIESKDRSPKRFQGPIWGDHRHSPSRFLDVKRRDAIVHAMDQFLKTIP